MSLFRRTETRDAASWDALRTFASGGGPLMGSSQKEALRLVPLFGATDLIASSISMLPMTGYEVVNGERRKMVPQPSLCWTPHVNPLFTRGEWLHQFAVSFLLRGNAFGLITQLDDRFRPSKVLWLHPDHVRVDESTSTPGYYYHDKPLSMDTLLHIPWYPAPGTVVGLDPINQFRLQMETGMSAAKFGNNWFRRGASPSGHLKHLEATLTERETDIVKRRFRAAVDGNDFFVTGKDWEWNSISVTAEQSQFLQTIKANANTFATIFHVNPEDIGGEAGSSLTYATVELNQIKFHSRATQPLYTRLENHLARIMPPFEYIKFNPDALIRTDSKTRAEVHEINLRTGMETQPEGRALEDRAPLTVQEQDDWQKHYRSAEAEPDEIEKARRIGEIIQKIYLGVGVVITEEEAREIVRMTGMILPRNVTVKTTPAGPANQEGA